MGVLKSIMCVWPNIIITIQKNLIPCTNLKFSLASLVIDKRTQLFHIEKQRIIFVRYDFLFGSGSFLLDFVYRMSKIVHKIQSNIIPATTDLQNKWQFISTKMVEILAFQRYFASTYNPAMSDVSQPASKSQHEGTPGSIVTCNPSLRTCSLNNSVYSATSTSFDLPFICTQRPRRIMSCRKFLCSCITR